MSIFLSIINRHYRFYSYSYWIVVIVGALLWLTKTSPGIFLIVNKWLVPAGVTFMNLYTNLGEGWFFLLMLLLLLVKSKKWAFAGLLSFAVSSGIAQLLKYRFGTVPRPANYFAIIHVPIQVPESVHVLQWQSFPSGHTISAFALALLVTGLSRNHLIQLAVLALAIGVGFSRMYLCQHFYRDVFVGMIIGTESAAFTLILINYYLKRKNQTLLTPLF